MRRCGASEGGGTAQFASDLMGEREVERGGDDVALALAGRPAQRPHHPSALAYREGDPAVADHATDRPRRLPELADRPE